MFPKDIKVVKIKNYHDHRGHLEVKYEGDGAKSIALKSSQSKKGVFRGLHYQLPPKSQKKVIQVITGNVLDIIIDMRVGFSTFGKIYSKELEAKENEVLIIPDYYAHGFLALTDCTFQYMTFGRYCDEAEICLGLPVNYFKNLKINTNEIILSDKDQKALDYNKYFK